MTDNCDICGKFYEWNGEWVCNNCIPILDAELAEAEAGLGTGSCISGNFGTREYCRHTVKRSSNVPMGKLRLLT